MNKEKLKGYHQSLSGQWIIVFTSNYRFGSNMVQLTPSERSSNQIFFGFVGKFLWNSETFMHPSHPPNHNPPNQDRHQLIGWWPTTFGNFDFFEPMMPLTPSCWPKARIIETATSKKLFAFSDTKRRYESLHEHLLYMKAPMQIGHPKISKNANESPSSNPCAGFASLPPTRCHLQSPDAYRTSLQFSEFHWRILWATTLNS